MVQVKKSPVGLKRKTEKKAPEQVLSRFPKATVRNESCSIDARTVASEWLFFFGFKNWRIGVEREFHLWLKERSQNRIAESHTAAENKNQLSLTVANGDDAAVVDFFDKPLVIATDTIAEGTHFLLPKSGDVLKTLDQIGYKALAVSLSDIAAMGAVPLAATLNFQCPKSMSLEQVKSIFGGAESLANQFSFEIVGGDTNSWEGALVITSTVFGTRPSGLAGWSLGDAQIGDWILVSGELGGSIHRRHLSFVPRLELSKFLVQNYSVHAVTDATDSLTADLWAIAKASRVRMEIELAAIPISPDVQSDNISALDHALSDGEDFELVFTLPPTQAKRLLADGGSPTPVTKIGTVVNGSPGLYSQNGGEINVIGYDH